MDFWRTRKPYKLLKGGRFSSKTQDAGGMATFLARNYTLRFLCIRQFQNKIAESVYTVLKNKIEEAGWTDEFYITNNAIVHKKTGSDFLFYGISRHIEEIKGTENVDICWIEEGEGLTERQWEIIDPTIRKEGAEIWILWNPRLVSDFTETKLPALLGDQCIIRHINYDENPFLSETAKAKAERLKQNDPEAYEHVYMGVPRSDDDQVVIRRSWIEAAIDAAAKLGIDTGNCESRLGFDVADGGNDLCAQVHSKGIEAKWGELWKAGEDELLQSCTRVYQKAVSTGARITYDSIGVGASSGAKFDELNNERKHQNGYVKVTYNKFIAGAEVSDPLDYYVDDEEEQITNKEFFENLKAQTWWRIADRFRNTFNAVANGEKFNEADLISISPDMPDIATLITELSTPRRKWSKRGKVMVESKEDLKKREVDSPNYADAFVMAFSPEARESSAIGLMLSRVRR